MARWLGKCATAMLGALALLAVPDRAPAVTVLEAELDGAATNNTPGTAQAIPASAFTIPAPATAFIAAAPTATIQGRGGQSDVDFYSFMVAPPGAGVLLDIDDDPLTFDTVVAVFDSAGTLIALGDDSFPEDAGTALGTDSFVGLLMLAAPGTYYAAISDFTNFPNAFDTCASFQNLIRPDNQFGGSRTDGCLAGDSSFELSGVQPAGGSSAYTLHISQLPPRPVPGPGTLLLVGFGLVACAMGTGRRQHRRKTADA
jgi:hypothetical protein